MKRIFLTVCALAVVGGDAFAANAAKPNVLFILSDDHGLDGVGCYGSDRFKGRRGRAAQC